MLGKVAKEKGMTLLYGEDVVSFVAEKSYSEKYGARNMARFIQTEIEDPIADSIVSDRQFHIQTIRLSVSNGKIAIGLDQ